MRGAAARLMVVRNSSVIRAALVNGDRGMRNNREIVRIVKAAYVEAHLGASCE